MKIVSADSVSGKKVLLRLDLDIALQDGKVMEDYKIRAGLPTLNLCIQNASKVVVMGHLGRPEGKVVEDLRVAPIVGWLKSQGYASHLTSGRLEVLENLRFDLREEGCDLGFAKELAQMGDIYVNEAFSAHRPAVSTTVLPTLLPHFAGLRFAEEVEKLTQVRENPKKSFISEGKNLFIAIMGGAKVKDKLPVIEILAQKADAVLVGGKLVSEIREQQLNLPKNVLVGKLTEDGFDIAEETVLAWENLIRKASMIVWNGPVGRVQSSEFTVYSLGSEKGSYELAKAILETKAESIIGGGDIIAFLGRANLLKDFESHGFVSVGGGAMLKLLSDGTLPTVEVLS